MENSISNQLLAYYAKLADIGVDDTMGTVANKRIRTFNLCIFVCLPLITIYWIVSYFSMQYLVANFYLLLIFLLILLLRFNYLKKGESHRIGVLITLVVSLSVGSILFDNGLGYFVLLIALLSIHFNTLRKKQLYLSLSYAVAYITIEIITFFVKPVEQSPAYIKAINLIIVLFILFYFLYDNKKGLLKFSQENINEKQNLRAFNSLLINQALSLELKNKSIEDLKDRNEELSSIVYHQLRSPVAAFADILSQYLDSETYSKEEFRHMSEIVHKKVTGILGVVDNLLKWNTTDADPVEPKVLKCNINNIVQKVMIQMQPLLEKKNVKINFTKPDASIAFADRDHVLIILQNILTNAIKFSPPNENIYIEIPDIKNICKVRITNSGKGISNNRLKTLFSNHQIISTKGTLNEAGTGLGLKICKKLVEKNKGSIQIVSEVNKSTTVIIELPAISKDSDN